MKRSKLVAAAKKLSKENLYTKEDVLILLGVTDRTFYRYLKKVEIDYITLPDETKLYKESGILKLLGLNSEEVPEND